jgi:dihydroneopterin aldolase
MATDIIFIQGLLVKAFIGVAAWEQQIRQNIVLDLELKVDIAPAGKSSNLTDTVDYCELAKHITTFIEESHFVLLETLAEQVAEQILKHPLVQGVRLSVAKPFIIANAKQVGVVIERG